MHPPGVVRRDHTIVLALHQEHRGRHVRKLEAPRARESDVVVDETHRPRLPGRGGILTEIRPRSRERRPVGLDEGRRIELVRLREPLTCIRAVEGSPQAARRLHPRPPVEAVCVRGDASHASDRRDAVREECARRERVRTTSRGTDRREPIDPEGIEHRRCLGRDGGDVTPGVPGRTAVAGPGERDQADAAGQRGVEQWLEQAPGLWRPVMPDHHARGRVVGAAVMRADRAAIGEANVEQFRHRPEYAVLRGPIIRDTRAMRVYFAGPLFTTPERAWNAEVTSALRAAGHEVFLPQEQEPGKDGPGIFATDVGGIDWADGLVAIMDGPDPDSGTAWEVGYAFGKKRPVVLVRTDTRAAGTTGDYNPMLTQSATARIDLPAASTAVITMAILDALARIEADRR